MRPTAPSSYLVVGRRSLRSYRTLPYDTSHTQCAEENCESECRPSTWSRQCGYDEAEEHKSSDQEPEQHGAHGCRIPHHNTSVMAIDDSEPFNGLRAVEGKRGSGERSDGEFEDEE